MKQHPRSPLSACLMSLFVFYELSLERDTKSHNDGVYLPNVLVAVFRMLRSLDTFLLRNDWSAARELLKTVEKKKVKTDLVKELTNITKEYNLLPIHVNDETGSDECGDGTFALPYRTVAHAVISGLFRLFLTLPWLFQYLRDGSGDATRNFYSPKQTLPLISVSCNCPGKKTCIGCQRPVCQRNLHQSSNYPRTPPKFSFLPEFCSGGEIFFGMPVRSEEKRVSEGLWLTPWYLPNQRGSLYLGRSGYSSCFYQGCSRVSCDNCGLWLLSSFHNDGDKPCRKPCVTDPNALWWGGWICSDHVLCEEVHKLAADFVMKHVQQGTYDPVKDEDALIELFSDESSSHDLHGFDDCYLSLSRDLGGSCPQCKQPFVEIVKEHLKSEAFLRQWKLRSEAILISNKENSLECGS